MPKVNMIIAPLSASTKSDIDIHRVLISPIDILRLRFGASSIDAAVNSLKTSLIDSGQAPYS